MVQVCWKYFENLKKVLDKDFDDICYSVLFFPYIPRNDVFYISPVVLCYSRSRKRGFAIMFIQVHIQLFSK